MVRIMSPSLSRFAALWAWGLALTAAAGCPCKRSQVKMSPEAHPPAATPSPVAAPAPPAEAAFVWQADRFADLRVLRYQIPGFAELSLRDKQLCYYLTEAALSGRDISWDQNYRHNLLVRKTLEAILSGDVGSWDHPERGAFLVWAKRVLFSSGVHHHYSTHKFTPGFGQATFDGLVRGADPARLPLAADGTVDDLIRELTPVIFDPALDAVRVEQTPGADMVAGSANNFYGQGLTQAEVEAFYGGKHDPEDPTPVSHGLNSRLVKREGALVEEVWRVGGLYGPALERVVSWLRKAIEVTEGPAQREALERLVAYYESGDLAAFDAYNVAWLADTDSMVDVVNGFIETYGDPLGFRATWESVVSIRDLDASRRISAVAAAADWFEANSPIADAHKKAEVTGIDAKVITIVGAGGDTSPTLPLGINLPNADWIRANHGSKSVNLGNVAHAYHEANKHSGLLEEFSGSEEVVARARVHGLLADNLHTDLHEVIGHASGQLEPGVAEMHHTLQQYSHVLEEARADLVALYYLMDPKLVEMGLMPSLDVGRTAYDDYIRNGLLVQLARVELGQEVAQAHMRNRQTISAWAYDRGQAAGVIERVERDGKIYFTVRDYHALRGLFGQLLAEVQRIKSQGDYDAGKALVETYGVKPDPVVHAQVRERYAALDLAPYSGFINPRLVPVRDDRGAIVDVVVEYPDDFVAQMLEYGERYAFLPAR